MGLFQKIFGGAKKPRGMETIFRTLNGYMPTFTSWGGCIYESELVRSSIDAIARNISKLSIEINGNKNNSLLSKLKKAPNEWQTWSQFLYRLSTILDVQNTAFVVPVYNEFGEQTGLYPILPNQCELKQFGGEVYVKYFFNNGETAIIELRSIGILTRFQYSHDFFGEKNGALIPTMELINIQNQGINEAIKSSSSYRFMAQLTNFTKSEDLVKERNRFNKDNFQTDEGGGMLLFPNTYANVKQIESKPYVVDAEQMKLIQTNVYNYFGVNEEVLQNKCYGDSWNAFYEGCIEPFSIQFSEVMTKVLFTLKERAEGSFVMATSNRLQYMSNADKLNVSAQLADRGIMNRDEIREIWNLPPLPNGEGQAYILRGEYYDATVKLNNDNSNNNSEGESQTDEQQNNE